MKASLYDRYTGSKVSLVNIKWDQIHNLDHFHWPLDVDTYGSFFNHRIKKTWLLISQFWLSFTIVISVAQFWQFFRTVRKKVRKVSEKKSLNSVIKCPNYLFFVLFCSCYTETDFQRYELTVWKVSKQLHVNKQENYSVNAVKGSSYETKSFSCKAALHETIMPLFRTI